MTLGCTAMNIMSSILNGEGLMAYVFFFGCCKVARRILSCERGVGGNSNDIENKYNEVLKKGIF